MAFRFIHTGDLHLDSPLTGLRAAGDDRAAKAADASRHAFLRLVEIAIERKVDAVLIAGDLWDGDWTDMDAGLMVAREAAKLREAGIAVVAILGNHDAAAPSVTAHVRRLQSIQVLSESAPESVDIGPAILHGQSFDSPAVDRNLVIDYPAPVAGRINVGLLHTGLDGKRGHSPYAPCSAEELAARGYDYFALAHVHTRAQLFNEPASQGGTAAYCGVLQGRHIRETGPKGAYMVSIEAPGARAELQPLDLPFVAWHRAEADVGDTTEGPAIAAALAGVAKRLPADLEIAVVRVVLKGSTERHHALHGAIRSLRDHAALTMSGIDPRLLLEDVRVETRPLDAAAPLPPLPQHFDDDLRAAAADPAVAVEAAESVRDLLAQLPDDVRRTLFKSRPDIAHFADGGAIAPLAHATVASLSARLRDAE